MKKTLLTALLAATLSAQSCYVLTEPTIGTINQDILGRLKDTPSLIPDAISKGIASNLAVGTKFCDTDERNFTWYRKRINIDNTLVWIDDRVKAEVVE